MIIVLRCFNMRTSECALKAIAYSTIGTCHELFNSCDKNDPDRDIKKRTDMKTDLKELLVFSRQYFKLHYHPIAGNHFVYVPGSMKDDVTIQRRLSLAMCINRLIPAVVFRLAVNFSHSNYSRKSDKYIHKYNLTIQLKGFVILQLTAICHKLKTENSWYGLVTNTLRTDVNIHINTLTIATRAIALVVAATDISSVILGSLQPLLPVT